MSFPAAERRNWSARDVYHIQTRTIAQVEIRSGRWKSRAVRRWGVREKGEEWRVEDARVKLVSGAKAAGRFSGLTPCIIPEQLHQAGTHEEPSIQTIRPPPPAPHEASPNTCAPTTFPDFAGAAVCEVNYRRIIAPYMPSVWLMRRGWARIIRDTRTFTCLPPILFCRQGAIRDFLRDNELLVYARLRLLSFRGHFSRPSHKWSKIEILECINYTVINLIKLIWF